MVKTQHSLTILTEDKETAAALLALLAEHSEHVDVEHTQKTLMIRERDKSE